MSFIEKNYKNVREHIRAACQRMGRDEDDCRLVVVSKYATVQQMEVILKLGHRDFGESRVQDAEKNGRAVPAFHRSLATTPSRHIQNGIGLQLAGCASRELARYVRGRGQILYADSGI